MTRHDKRRGPIIRAAIARTVLPRLEVGAAVPSSAPIANALGISRTAAWRHLTRTLVEAGVTTTGRTRRVVASMEARQ